MEEFWCALIRCLLKTTMRSRSFSVPRSIIICTPQHKGCFKRQAT